MSGSAYPDVPLAEGVPPVLRDPGAVLTDYALLTADAIGLDFLGAPDQWGIFDQDGFPVIVGDNVIALDYRRESRVSDAPVEQGGFQSYNKVATPSDAKVIYSIGGSNDERSLFLQSIDGAIDSTELYTVVTPEYSYPSVDVVHYDYRRTSQNGVTLLEVEVWVTEIRVTGTMQYTNTAAPSGADPVNGGTVQTQAPTAAQTTAANSQMAY